MEKLRNPIPDTNYPNIIGQPFEERYADVTTNQQRLKIFQDAYSFVTEGGVLSPRDLDKALSDARTDLPGGVLSFRDTMYVRDLIRTVFSKGPRVVTINMHDNKPTQVEVVKVDTSANIKPKIA